MKFKGSWIDRLLNPRASIPAFRRQADEFGAELAAPSGARGRLHARDIVLNLPLMIGGLIVLGLFALVLFGPVWAPENPYVSAQHMVPHFNARTGEYIRPPLSPSSEYPLGTDQWGNDLLSLLMHGARNTLVACAFITMVRVLLGTLLGGWAGWNEGALIDRAVMGATGVITSVPMLISSMLLIYALDIRRGLPVFIVALSLIGWTEIAQYIRSEFLVLRKQPYIEGARAVGLNGLGVAVRHVLPNVLPQLMVIAFLEMGAAMMLLGELGFVGVFIGGGSRIQREIDPRTVEVLTLVEVPEWGAMLADGYRWLRSKPFIIFPPAIAFFISVYGFNALGEGLRRLVEKNGLNTAFLLRKRMLLVIAALVLATIFIINNTGAAPWFAQVASTFSGEEAYEHVQALAAIDGRGVGQEGAAQAAAYIAQKFEDYGLEPGWTHSNYVYPLAVEIARPVDQPILALLDDSGAPVRTFRHQIDFGFVTQGHGGSGDVQARLTLVGFTRAPGEYDWVSFKGLDLRGKIVLLVERNAPAEFATEALIRGAEGVLWVVDDTPNKVRSQIRVDGSDALHKPGIPILRIRPAVTDALLAQDGLALVDMLSQTDAASQQGPGWFARDLAATVHISLDLAEPQKIEMPCVLGYKPGTDYDLARELIVVWAAYDSLGVDPDGTVYPGADRSASAVSVMLEIARLWHKQGLDARRSVLFVAWGGGQLDPSGAAEFLTHDPNFRHLPSIALNKPALLFQLDQLGAGEALLFIHPRSNRRLFELVQTTASEAGVQTADVEGTPGDDEDIVTRKIPWVSLSWWGQPTPPDQDSIERIEVERLQSAGEVLSLALTKIVRQSSY
ncbi:MAG: ABC transporter permease subunit [Anaerolineae bacterium]|nr:ABC transporter permease subunit [Anaerolineae bacterium]